MENLISFEDFEKIDLRVGKVISAERIEGSEKLLKLKVDFQSETRQIIAGIGQYVKPEEIIGKSIVFVFNLKPKKIFGYESQGMLLAAFDGKNLSLIVPEKEIDIGTKIK
ncbi:MAG: methionine--tRNA ligase subunit beta [Minisyncoccia bacterium]